ncbi:MAG: PhoH family protein [Bradymonadia bacterium]
MTQQAVGGQGSTPGRIEADPRAIAALWGPGDAHRKFLENALSVRIGGRADWVQVSGVPEAVAVGERVINELLAVVRAGRPVFLKDVEKAVRVARGDSAERPAGPKGGGGMVVTADRRTISPKTPNQGRYLEAIAKHDLVFGVGPAGTGKTYLAMAAAVGALRAKAVQRIILTRPAVEAGEKLGFLPGSLADKVNPYLRPLYDALYDMMDLDRAAHLVESGVIEVAPLAFMRGRTLNRAFVILDEAQNTTREQMKMFLTRLGNDSKAVVTGDGSQVDLPNADKSGLAHALDILKDIQGIASVRFSDIDVVRHSLVQSIIRAYDRDDQAKGKGQRK